MVSTVHAAAGKSDHICTGTATEPPWVDGRKLTRPTGVYINETSMQAKWNLNANSRMAHQIAVPGVLPVMVFKYMVTSSPSRS